MLRRLQCVFKMNTKSLRGNMETVTEISEQFMTDIVLSYAQSSDQNSRIGWFELTWVLSIGLLLLPTAHSNQTAASLVAPISLLLDECTYQLNVISIDALTPNPESVIANAGKNSTVEIDGSFGALTPT